MFQCETLTINGRALKNFHASWKASRKSNSSVRCVYIGKQKSRATKKNGNLRLSNARRMNASSGLVHAEVSTEVSWPFSRFRIPRRKSCCRDGGCHRRSGQACRETGQTQWHHNWREILNDLRSLLNHEPMARLRIPSKGQMVRFLQALTVKGWNKLVPLHPIRLPNP